MPRKEKSDNIELNDVREMVRKSIEEKFGGVAKFLHSEQGKKFGGMKIRPYLYGTGAVSYEVLRKLCEYLGIGILSRKVVVTRSYFYQLSKNTSIKK